MTFSLKTDSLKSKMILELKNILLDELNESILSDLEESLSFEKISTFISLQDFNLLKESLKNSKIFEIKKIKNEKSFEIQIFVESINKKDLSSLKNKGIIKESIDIFKQMTILTITKNIGEYNGKG